VIIVFPHKIAKNRGRHQKPQSTWAPGRNGTSKSLRGTWGQATWPHGRFFKMVVIKNGWNQTHQNA